MAYDLAGLGFIAIVGVIRGSRGGYNRNVGNVLESFETAHFGRGIVLLLQDDARVSQMRGQAREIAVNEYRRELQVERYIELYSQMLSGQMVRPARRFLWSDTASNPTRVRTQKG